ncbi:hypothetical protein [Haloarchaeobius sp. DT45]|uniref:hypothetical protein n=1 Tax=Haloarchaeobius sp. DT45 TaxID=3446116 RepID=UPI003F6C372E
MTDDETTRRRFLRLGTLTGVSLVTAGCLSESTTETPSSPSAATEGPTGATTGNSAGTTTFNQTYPTDVGTGDDPVDVLVGNGTDDTRRIELRVSNESEGDVVFEGTFTLRAGKQRYLDLFEHRATGVYLVEASTDSGASGSYTWNLSDRPAGGRLTVAIDGASVDFSWRIA